MPIFSLYAGLFQRLIYGLAALSLAGALLVLTVMVGVELQGIRNVCEHV
jgi:hypothetical protein